MKITLDRIGVLVRLARALGIATVILLPSCAPTSPPAAPNVAHGSGGTCTVFADVTVVPMDRERTIAHQNVTIRGDRIVEMGPTASVAVPAECAVIDGRHRFLIPGFTDSHVHFTGFTSAGAGDVRVERAVLLLLVANGITTAINMRGSPRMLAVRDAVAREAYVGPTLLTTGPFIQMTGSGEAPGQRTFTTPDEVRAEVVAQKRAGYDFIKVHGDLPAETYDALLETARRENIPVVGHVPSNLGIDAALNGHQALIVHAEEFLYSYFQFHRELPTDPAEIDAMARSVAERTARAGTWVSPTLYVFRQIISEVTDIDATLQRPDVSLLPTEATRDWFPPNNPYVKRFSLERVAGFERQFRVMQRLVRALRDARVPLLAGTDPMAPCVVPGTSFEQELEQLVEAGLTPFEALETATSNPARFLHREASSGSIAPGKLADLILLSANPLDDISNASRQDGVMLRGAWYAEDELRAAVAKLRTVTK